MIGVIVIAQPSIRGEALPTESTELGFHWKETMNSSFSKVGVQLRQQNQHIFMLNSGINSLVNLDIFKL